jgi:hypothetical protein
MKFTSIALIATASAISIRNTETESVSAVNPAQCLAANASMCKWGEWSKLYSKCELYNIPAVGKLQGSAAITKWCGEQGAANKVWNCAETNKSMCQWGEWSKLYSKCELNNIPAVNKLQGSKQITAWCKATFA